MRRIRKEMVREKDRRDRSLCRINDERSKFENTSQSRGV